MKKADVQIPSEREIVDEIVKGQILLEEAERQGLSVTDEEIGSFLNETLYATLATPPGKEMGGGVLQKRRHDL